MSEESGMSHTQMALKFIDGIDTTLANWKPRKKFKLYNASEGIKSLENNPRPKHSGIIYKNKI